MTEDIKEPSEEKAEEVLNTEQPKVEIDNTIPDEKKGINWVVVICILVVVALIVAGFKLAGVF